MKGASQGGRTPVRAAGRSWPTRMEPPRDEWLNRQLRVIGRDLACLSESPRIDGMSVFGARSAVVWAFALAAVPGVQAQVARLTIEQLDHAAWSVRDGAPSYILSLIHISEPTRLLSISYAV